MNLALGTCNQIKSLFFALDTFKESHGSFQLRGHEEGVAGGLDRTVRYSDVYALGIFCLSQRARRGFLASFYYGFYAEKLKKRTFFRKLYLKHFKMHIINTKNPSEIKERYLHTKI